MIKSLFGKLFSRRSINTAKLSHSVQRPITITPQPITTTLQRSKDGCIVVSTRTDVKEHPDYPRKHLGYVTLIGDATMGTPTEKTLTPYAALLRRCRHERRYHLLAIRQAISEIEAWGFSAVP